jgi:uncharacterized membrane protein YozB (DUF420 family)
LLKKIKKYFIKEGYSMAKDSKTKNIINKKNNIFVEIFDTFFILIICFATLLSAMVMKGTTSGEINYSLNITTFIITISFIILYLSFMLFQSEKGLKETIRKRYDK